VVEKKKTSVWTHHKLRGKGKQRHCSLEGWKNVGIRGAPAGVDENVRKVKGEEEIIVRLSLYLCNSYIGGKEKLLIFPL